MDIINFAWSAIAGGATYDALKIILGDSFEKLNNFFKDDNKEMFKSHLETIFSVNKQIEEQLIALQNGQTSINSNNTIVQNGDNNKVKIG